MAQASKAIIPKDKGGPWGQRIGVSVGGSLSWALRVSAFVTGRVSSSDWNRYSIVVMNWYGFIYIFALLLILKDRLGMIVPVLHGTLYRSKLLLNSVACRYVHTTKFFYSDLTCDY